METEPLPIFWQPGAGLPGNDLEFRSRETIPYTRLEREYRVILNEILIKPHWWIKMEDPEIRKKWKTEGLEALTNLRRMSLAFDNDTATYPLRALSKANHDSITQRFLSEASTQSGEDCEDSPTEFTGQKDEGEENSEQSTPSESDEDVEESPEERAPVENAERWPTWQSNTELIDSTVAFMLQELREIADRSLLTLQHLSNDGVTNELAFASPTSAHGVFLSDDLVPPKTLTAFAHVVAPLEDEALSRDIAVDRDGRAKISSYINNLDRHRYPRVYGAMRAIFEGMLPLFERAVDALETEPHQLIDASLSNNDFMDHDWQ
ncbi:hypothetical protein HDU93_002824, partial [Gonapodya sp. JEL0774]